MKKRNEIRNIAIIAHVDHGKTTLVDQILKQSGTFRQNQVVLERVMDSGDIEKERGITILSKNTAVYYKDTKINIVDTPGHADFGGEVERVLKMVDGVVLVVDAFEGPMPQTKFVLKNALALNLPVVVCINKIDRPDARPKEVIDEVLELFMELDATDEQLDASFIFTSAKKGIASLDFEKEGTDMLPFFETIIKEIPAPTSSSDNLKILISTIDHKEYQGKIGIGKVESGTIKINDEVILVNIHDEKKFKKVRVTKLFEFEGLTKVEVKEATFGSIIAIAGIEDITIGDTICSIEDTTPIPFAKVSPPTISVNFIVNNSPFAGTEGKFITSRHLRDRLMKETDKDVSLLVEETDSTEMFKVSGRGELHISILIENMRREGFEFAVSKPEVLFKEENKIKMEPIEEVTVDSPEEHVGSIIESLSLRKGEMTYMGPSSGGYTRLKFKIPARGLIGYRTDFLTLTKGEGLINNIFEGYEPYKGEISHRQNGALIAFESGETTSYGLSSAEERGVLFINPGVKVYAGMVVGKNSRNADMEVNICKRKQLTNIRASGSDDNIKLTPATILSLEQSLEFISDDELVEITPTSLRIRKRQLDSNMRAKEAKSRKKENS
ncbi:MAG: translational GTPase TypA [Defluviitaleaceae bacterium]|nr:translational GTPase TypA [Defluviitaleaceae bacterium]